MWEFTNSFRKLIGLARDSFGAEDLALAISSLQPRKDDSTLVVQIHIALLSKLLAGGREAEDAEEEGFSGAVIPREIAAKRKKLKMAHEQLRKLPITHLTWFEVLRKFVELAQRSKDESHEEEDIEDAESDEDDEKGDKKEKEKEKEEKEKAKEREREKEKKKKDNTTDDPVITAAEELSEKEYDTLSLKHKLAILEYLCYEVENTIAFRSHIKKQVDVVEGLHKERWAEEMKLKKSKKLLEEELQEKKKMQALKTDDTPENDNNGAKSTDNKSSTASSSSSKSSKSQPTSPDPSSEYVLLFFKYSQY